MKTIRARLTAVSLATAALSLTAGVWGMSALGQQLLTQQLREDLARDAQRIAAAPDAQAIDAAVAGTAPGRLAQVRGADGTIIAASKNRIRQSQDLQEVEVLPAATAFSPAASADGPGRGEPWTTGSSDLMALDAGWETVTTGPGTERGQVILAAPTADIQATVRTFTTLAAAGVPVLTALTGLLVWAMLGRALRPIDQARRLAAEALETYPPPLLQVRGGVTEIDSLVTTFEALLASAAAGVRTQRRFLANAAHELLSPLAVLRTNLEVSIRQDPAPGVHRALQRCVQTQARLEALAQQLLALARAETVDQAQHVEIDLVRLLHDVVVDLPPQHKKDITVHAPDRLLMVGDPTGLRQLIDNLAQNACRHAASTVTLSLVGDRDAVHLHIDDDGPGIPAAARPSVLEPFSRISDPTAPDARGAGLGLAIAKAVAERHGGQIELSDSACGGTSAMVVLPRRGLALAPR